MAGLEADLVRLDAAMMEERGEADARMLREVMAEALRVLREPRGYTSDERAIRVSVDALLCDALNNVPPKAEFSLRARLRHSEAIIAGLRARLTTLGRRVRPLGEKDAGARP